MPAAQVTGSIMLDGTTLRSLHSALDGLMARERATSDNIANVNTPYYTAKRVSFENDLRAAVARGGDPGTVQATTTYSTAARQLNGNNVDLDAETVSALETSLRYELALRATGDRFTLLRSAARAV